jgi:hypothetical protein
LTIFASRAGSIEDVARLVGVSIEAMGKRAGRNHLTFATTISSTVKSAKRICCSVLEFR